MSSIYIYVTIALFVFSGIITIINLLKIRKRLDSFFQEPITNPEKKNNDEVFVTELRDIGVYGELAFIEGALENLNEVIIFLDEVEKPMSSLETTVKDNIERYNVKYSFFVSESNAKNIEKYYSYFNAFLSKEYVKRNIHIKSFDFKWRKSKIIFYSFMDNGEKTIISYKGVNKNKNNITYSYTALDEDEINNLLGLAFKGVNYKWLKNKIKVLKTAEILPIKKLDNGTYLLRKTP